MTDDLPVHTDSLQPRLPGYARASTDDQDLSLQIDALTRQGIPKTCTFMDKLSGAKTERPRLTRCLGTLQSVDILVVRRLDRLGRSMRHSITPVEDLRSKGIGFRSLSEDAIDTTSASGELMFNIFSALTQFERRRIQERTKAGLAAARARGHNGGRPKVTSDEARVVLAKMLHSDRSLEIDDVCKTLRISRSTFYRYMRMGWQCQFPLVFRHNSGKVGASRIMEPYRSISELDMGLCGKPQVTTVRAFSYSCSSSRVR
jgi:DNA invertase Pin-like site-specific DNA recombinase